MNDSESKMMAAAIAGLPVKKREQISAFILNDATLPSQSIAIIEPYRTLKELGDQLHFHPSTLWRWGIPKHELAGRPRFLASEVVAYLESDAFKIRARTLRRDRKNRRTAQ